jgi:hypothetical protein
MRCAAVAFVLLAAAPCGAAAAGELVLAGHARTGTDARDVRFGFACTGNGPGVTGALSVTLAVPRPEQLAAEFAFDPFEGPDVDAGALTELRSTGSGGGAQGRFTVAGSYGVDPDTPFVFDLAAAIRDDRARLAALARVLRPLTTSPGKLVWRQGNTTQGGVPIVASLDLTAADAEGLRAALAPCLAAAER